MARAVFPDLDNDRAYICQAYSILDEMISKGNRVAELRKRELIYLEDLCQDFSKESELRGLETLILPYPMGLDMESEGNSTTQPDSITLTASDLSIPEHTPEHMPFVGSVDEHTGSENLTVLEDIGISSDEFFSIVDQMGNWDHLVQDLMDFQQGSEETYEDQG